MKFSASPLVVAVALGLIGPIALEPDAEDADSGLRERAQDPSTVLLCEDEDDDQA